MILSGSPFDCDCLVALLSVTIPGSRVCIVVRWYKKYTGSVPEIRRHLWLNSNVSAEFHEIYMICLHTSNKHFVQIWMNSPLTQQIYMHLFQEG